jgi:hypothetical protein
MTRIELDHGKYTVIHNDGMNLHALRHGEAWRDLSGDGLILAMAQEIEALREAALGREGRVEGFTSIDTLPEATDMESGYRRSVPILLLFENGEQAVGHVAYDDLSAPDAPGFRTREARVVTHSVIGWMHLPPAKLA